MSAAVPLLCLIALLGLLSMLQAHHPGETRDQDRVLAVVASAQGLVVLVLALSQVLSLVRP
ncbi:hypothetical protein G6553_19965 [Nocardioides sp. IC4_145]|uniref:hypothetical protein n=1 Tax=Nocardioides sp. IC4_145 TaxID=2714037 RepID=UPI0014089850|nr:hypothetical protein [Nocardioides sp. IC4_145]NHC25440.1 hypothetical protein [Nocardioides sp. IC4_145]